MILSRRTDAVRETGLNPFAVDFDDQLANSRAISFLMIDAETNIGPGYHLGLMRLPIRPQGSTGLLGDGDDGCANSEE